MAQINQYGYERIRSFIIENWKYLELRTPTGTVLKRFSTSDGLIITGNANTQEIQFKVVVSGSDPAFNGQTVGKSVLFDVASGGSAIATESFTGFTFEGVDDELTVIHKMQVPQVV